MKRTIYTIMLGIGLALTLALGSCGESTTDPNTTTPTDTTTTTELVTPSAKSLTFTEDIDELDLSIDPKAAGKITWTVRHSAAWLRVSVDRGEGKGKIVVSIARNLIDRAKSYLDTLIIEAKQENGAAAPVSVAGMGKTFATTGSTTKIPVTVSPTGMVAGNFQALNRQLPGAFQVALEEIEKYSNMLDSGVTTLITAGSPTAKGAAGMFIRSGSLPQNVGYVSVKGNVKMVTVMGRTVDAIKPDTLALKSFTSTSGGTGYVYVDTALASATTAIEFSASQYHRWWADGNATFPRIADSVVAIDKTTISSPTSGSSSTDTSALTISWSNPSNDAAVRAVAIVYQKSDSTFRSTGVYGADNGSLVIDAAKMKKFGGKNVTVVLIRFRVETRTIGGVTVKFLVLNESSVDMFISKTS